MRLPIQIPLSSANSEGLVNVSAKKLLILYRHHLFLLVLLSSEISFQVSIQTPVLFLLDGAVHDDSTIGALMREVGGIS